MGITTWETEHNLTKVLLKRPLNQWPNERRTNSLERLSGFRSTHYRVTDFYRYQSVSHEFTAKFPQPSLNRAGMVEKNLHVPHI